MSLAGRAFDSKCDFASPTIFLGLFLCPCTYHQMVNTEIRLIIFFAAKDGDTLYSQQKTRPEADCGSDHKLFIAKFRLTLNKVGKTTRAFRYDLNQIPYDYTVEVTNRCKGLDLIDCLKNYGWKFVTLIGGRDKDHP